MIKFFENSSAYQWGSLASERDLIFPCDKYVLNPDDVLFRAITINAGAGAIFPWLCQLRVAPYSYDWIDNGGRPSPQRIQADLQDLKQGQTVMSIFELVEFKKNEHITAILSDKKARIPFGAIALTYQIIPISDLACRLVVKMGVKRPGPFPFNWLSALLPWGDLIMMRKTAHEY